MKKLSNYIFILLIFLLFVLMFIAFYKSSFLIDGSPATDYPCHIAISQNIKSNELSVFYCNFVPPYKLYHFLVSLGSFLFNRNYEVSSSMVLLFAQIFTYLLILDIYVNEFKHFKPNLFEKIIIFLTLFIICLPFNGKLYLPQGSPNIWHNPTYIFVRPFGILSFYSFYIIHFKKKERLSRWYFIFTFSTFLSSLAKPSFVMVFLPVAGIFVLFDLITKKFKNIKYGIYMLLSVLPTLLILIYQYNSINNYEAITTNIGFGTFLRLDIISSLFSTFCCLFYPVFILYKNKNKIKQNKDIILLSICTLVMGWLQYYFLYQDNISSGDFAWGYFWAIFMIYSITTNILLDNFPKKIDFQVIIFFVQAGLGIMYFVNYTKTLNYLSNLFTIFN